jgi:replicative DNA helicase
MPRPGKATGEGLFGLSARHPPNNLQAEQALLGALLANNKAYERVCEFLKPEHFADPVHGVIYEAIQKRIEAGRVADTITLRAEFEHSGLLEEVGGAAYLVQLLAAMVGVINAGEYGRAIFDCFLRRNLIDIGEVIVNRAFGLQSNLDGTAQINAAQELLNEVCKRVELPDRGVMFGAAVREAIARGERSATLPGGMAGLSSGFRGIDLVLGGMEPGWLIVLGGRPAMGKSALGLQIALRAASGVVPRIDVDDLAFSRGAPAPTLYLSTEMESYQLGRRGLSLRSGVPLVDLRNGRFVRHADAAMAVVKAAQHFDGIPLLIEDTPGPNLAQIEMRIRTALRRLGSLKLVVVDHLHNMRRAEEHLRLGDTFAIGAITRGIKELARRYSVPILLLAQLNRGVEGRDDKRPTLADLRQSGNIEEDADCVGLLYREEYYLAKRQPDRGAFKSEEDYLKAAALHEQRLRISAGRAEVLWEKVRDGQPGISRLHFDTERVRFFEEGE